MPKQTRTQQSPRSTHAKNGLQKGWVMGTYTSRRSRRLLRGGSILAGLILGVALIGMLAAGGTAFATDAFPGGHNVQHQLLILGLITAIFSIVITFNLLVIQSLSGQISWQRTKRTL